MGRGAEVCRTLVVIGIGALVLFTPLAFGSVELWATVILETMLFAIAGVWLLGRALSRSSPPPITARLSIPVVSFVAVVLFQLVPLPGPVLGVLSPRASALYERTVPGYARSAPSFEDWLLASDRSRAEIAPSPTGPSRSLPISYAPAETWDRVILFAAYTLLFFVAADVYRNEGRRRRLVVWIVFVGVGVAIEGVFQKLAWNGKVLWLRSPPGQAQPFGPFVNPNHFAGYMELIVPLALALLLTLLAQPARDEEAGVEGLARREHPSERGTWMRPGDGEGPSAQPWTSTHRIPKAILLGFLVALSIASIVLSLSRGGFMATLLTFGLFSPALLRPARAGQSRTAMLAGVAALLVITASVAFWLGASAIGHRASTLATMRSDESIQSRVDTYWRTTDLIRDHPILGVGLGGFETAFSGYYPPQTYLIYKQTHNDYLQLLAEVGIIGAFPAFYFLLVILRGYLWPVVLDRSRHDRYLLLGLCMAIVSLLLHSFVDFNLQIPAVGFLFVLIGAMLVASQRDGSKSPGPASASTAAGRRLAWAAVGAAVLMTFAVGTIGARRLTAQRLAVGMGRSWRGEAVAGTFDRAMALSPGQPSALSALGDGAIASFDDELGGGHREALDRLLGWASTAYRAAIARTPLSAWGWWGMGEVMARRSQLERLSGPFALDALPPTGEESLPRQARLALASLRTALFLEPNSYQIHDDLAYLYRDERLHPFALAVFKDSARIMPLYYLHDYPPAQDLRPDVYEAITAGMEESLRAQDTIVDASAVCQSLGDIALARRDLEAAEKAYRRGFGAAGSELMEGTLAYLLGEVLQQRGKGREARPLLERAIQTPSVAWRAWAALGHLRSAEGDHGGAMEAYRRAVSLAPEPAEWPNIFLAAEMAGNGDRPGAIAKLRYLVSVQPDSLSARELLVNVLIAEHNRSSALAEARSLEAIAPARDDYRKLVESLSSDSQE